MTFSLPSPSCLRKLPDRGQATAQGNAPAIGDLVIVQAEERNRGKWPLGMVEKVIVSTDGIVRGAVLRSGKPRIERAVQYLYPIELSCDRPRPQLAELNPQAQPFRPRREAAVAARVRVQNIARNEL